MSMTLTISSNPPPASAWLEVCSITDGLSGLLFAFNAISAEDAEFDASIMSADGSENGWSIQKTSHGYLLFFVCFRSVSGFLIENGAFYAYKIGKDSELLDWPGVEFGKIPRSCFLERRVFKDLFIQICKSENPRDAAGFSFSHDHWECVTEIE